MAASAPASTIDLPPEAASAGHARDFAREVLTPTYAGAALDMVAVVVTELVANAIVHSHTPVRLRVAALPGRARIEVADGSSSRPRRRAPDPDGPTGRGLVLVDALASSWGVADTPAGKQVWCEVPC